MAATKFAMWVEKDDDTEEVRVYIYEDEQDDPDAGDEALYFGQGFSIADALADIADSI